MFTRVFIQIVIVEIGKKVHYKYASTSFHEYNKHLACCSYAPKIPLFVRRILRIIGELDSLGLSKNMKINIFRIRRFPVWIFLDQYLRGLSQVASWCTQTVLHSSMS